ncbi:MAG: flippase-like domain-containing protein [Armatimonadota bacterium]|nr:flippase-like domain-containing protein [Armatimonadota bacterium]
MKAGKVILGVLVLAGFALVLAPNVGEFSKIAPVLTRLRMGWCVGCVLCQGLVYLCLAGMLRAGLGTAPRVSWAFLTGVSVVFLFANRALPGPALAGLMTLVFLLGRRGVSAASAQAAATVFYLADYVSFFALALLSLGLILRTSQVADLHPALLGAALGVILIVATGAWALLRSPRAVRVLVMRGALIWGRRRPDPQALADAAAAAADAFFDRWRLLTARPGSLTWACVWGLGMHLAETLTLVCAARAFGVGLPPGLAAAGYVTGNLAAIVSFLPGGVGFYEGAMVTTWHSIGGVPVAAGLAVTLLYRLLSVWLPLPFVLGTVRQALASGSRPPLQ